MKTLKFYWYIAKDFHTKTKNMSNFWSIQRYFYHAFQKLSQNMKSVCINSREQQQKKQLVIVYISQASSPVSYRT